MTRRFTPPPECPVCGATVPPNARSCPECGADERTGWDEEATIYDGLDLPEERYDEPPSDPAIPCGVAWYWWVVGVALIFILALTFLGLR